MLCIEWPTSPALLTRIAGARAAVKPDSRSMRDLRADVMSINGNDHIDKMLRGVDRYGRPRAPLAQSTRDKIAKGKRGPGPSLIPNVFTSRYLTTFSQRWVWREGRSELSSRFDGFVSKRGFPIPMAHEAGVPRRNLPRRAVMGITPKGWSEVNKRMTVFADKVFNALEPAGVED